MFTVTNTYNGETVKVRTTSNITTVMTIKANWESTSPAAKTVITDSHGNEMFAG